MDFGVLQLHHCVLRSLKGAKTGGAQSAGLPPDCARKTAPARPHTHTYTRTKSTKNIGNAWSGAKPWRHTRTHPRAHAHTHTHNLLLACYYACACMSVGRLKVCVCVAAGPPQERPRGLRIPPGAPQEGPKTAQNAPQIDPKIDQKSSCRKMASKTAPRPPKSLPRRPPDPPRTRQNPPKTFPRPSRVLLGLSIGRPKRFKTHIMCSPCAGNSSPWERAVLPALRAQ